MNGDWSALSNRTLTASLWRPGRLAVGFPALGELHGAEYRRGASQTDGSSRIDDTTTAGGTAAAAIPGTNTCARMIETIAANSTTDFVNAAHFD